jgi:hypothetical protein
MMDVVQWAQLNSCLNSSEQPSAALHQLQVEADLTQIMSDDVSQIGLLQLGKLPLSMFCSLLSCAGFACSWW